MQEHNQYTIQDGFENIKKAIKNSQPIDSELFLLKTHVTANHEEFISEVKKNLNDEGYELIKFLSNNGVFTFDMMNKKGGDGLSILDFSARNAKECFKLFAKANFKDGDENSLLHLAVRQNNTVVVELLIRNGCDPLATNKNQTTPFKIALLESNKQVIKNYIVLSQEIEIEDKNLQTPLHWLMQFSDNISVECVKELISEGAFIDYDLYKKDINGNTALHFACRNNPQAYLDFISNSPLIYFNLQNNNGEFPISFAIENYDANFFSKIIDKTPKNILKMENDLNDNTLLHIAALKNCNDQKTIIEELIKAGVDTAIKNKNGETFLHLLANKEIIKILIGKKYIPISLINTQNNEGKTILHKSLIFGEIIHADFLITNGANINIKSNSGATALEYYKNYRITFAMNLELKDDQLENKGFFSISENELKKFKLEKRLFAIYGGEKIKDCFDYSLETGGEFWEGVSEIAYHLQLFIKNQPPEENHRLNKIWEIFSFYNHSLSSDEAASKILSGAPLLFHVGFNSHASIGIFSMDNNELNFTFIDRGPLSDRISITNLCYPIKIIKIPKDKSILIEILDLIKEASISSQEKAKKLLLIDVAIKTGNSYVTREDVPSNFLAKHYKVGICYWTNPKTAAHYLFRSEFLNELGFKVGQTKYKEFDLFIHKQILKEYKEQVPFSEQNKKLVPACEKIIEQKETKLANGYIGPNNGSIEQISNSKRLS